VKYNRKLKALKCVITSAHPRVSVTKPGNFVETRTEHLSSAGGEDVERMESIFLHRKVKGK
jgi:hypothetical protein